MPQVRPVGRVGAEKEDEMTNEELDAACCEFAGLEPETRFIHESRCGARTDRCDCPDRPPVKAYPDFSTDWGAAGRLMEALAAKGIMAAPSPVRYFTGPTMGVRWVAAAFDGKIGTKEMEADSGPRALCLAVAALAEASGKEAGR